MADESSTKDLEAFSKPSVIKTRGAKGKEFLRQRAVWARSYVYLESLKEQKIGVSIWEVMRKAQARKPYETSRDLDLVIDAAIRLGMRIVKEKNTVLLQAPGGP